MKFLVRNYSCLQNPWLGGLLPPDPCPLSSTQFAEPLPNKIPGYATDCEEEGSRFLWRQTSHKLTSRRTTKWHCMTGRTDTSIASWMRGSWLRSTDSKLNKFGNKVCLLRWDAVYRNQKITTVYGLLLCSLQRFRWYFGTYFPTRVHCHRNPDECHLHTHWTASHLMSYEIRVFVQSSLLGSSFFLSISRNTRFAWTARVLHISLQPESQTHLKGYVLVKPEARRKAYRCVIIIIIFINCSWVVTRWQ